MVTVIIFTFLCTDDGAAGKSYLFTAAIFTTELVLAVCHLVFCPHDVFVTRCSPSSPSEMNIKVIVIHKSLSAVFEMSGHVYVSEVSVDPAAGFCVRSDSLLFALMWKDPRTPLNSGGPRDHPFSGLMERFQLCFIKHGVLRCQTLAGIL